MPPLTEEMVRASARVKSLDDVKRLNCWGMDITDISILARMPNLEVLSLSVNAITTLKDVAHCPKLKELYVRKNKLASVREILHLAQLPALRILWIADNPFEQDGKKRATIIRALPGLVKLDNEPVSMAERLACAVTGEALEGKPEQSTLTTGTCSTTTTSAPTTAAAATNADATSSTPTQPGAELASHTGHLTSKSSPSLGARSPHARSSGTASSASPTIATVTAAINNTTTTATTAANATVEHNAQTSTLSTPAAAATTTTTTATLAAPLGQTAARESPSLTAVCALLPTLTADELLVVAARATQLHSALKA